MGRPSRGISKSFSSLFNLPKINTATENMSTEDWIVDDQLLKKLVFQGLNSFNSNHDCSVMDSEDEHNDTVENNKNEPPMKTVAEEDEEENLNNDDTPEPDDSNENVSKYTAKESISNPFIETINSNSNSNSNSNEDSTVILPFASNKSVKLPNIKTVCSPDNKKTKLS